MRKLKKYRCKCPKYLVQEPCAGQITSATEVCTPFMAKKVIDGLFQDPVSPSGSSKPSKFDPASKAISALGGTFFDGTMHGDVSGSPSCGAFPNVFPPVVSLDISCPLDLSY